MVGNLAQNILSLSAKLVKSAGFHTKIDFSFHKND